MQKARKIVDNLLGLVGIVVAVIIFYHGFTVTINETSYLGIDKFGRQVFIQTLNNFVTESDNKVKVTSNYDDFNFVERIWQEPMLTTIRIYNNMSEEDINNFLLSNSDSTINRAKVIEKSLDDNYVSVLNIYKSEIILTKECSVTKEKFEEMAYKEGILTFRDLLTSFGFVNYEYFINDKLICRIILNPNVSNWVEGNITTKGGSIKNKPINK